MKSSRVHSIKRNLGYTSLILAAAAIIGCTDPSVIQTDTDVFNKIKTAVAEQPNDLATLLDANDLLEELRGQDIGDSLRRSIIQFEAESVDLKVLELMFARVEPYSGSLNADTEARSRVREFG